MFALVLADAINDSTSPSGKLGIKPPAQPSLAAKCRAFFGRGVSLAGEMTGCLSTNQKGSSAGTTPTSRCKQESLRGASAEYSTATRRNIGPAETGSQLSEGSRLDDGSENGGERVLLGDIDDGAGVGDGPSSMPETNTGGRLLGGGRSSVMSATQGRSRGATRADDAAAAAVDLGAGAAACGRCGKLVPTANLRLHELRCCSSKVARQQQPTISSRVEPCTEPEQTVSATPSARGAEVKTTPPPSTPTTVAPNAGFPCAFCGLNFRAAGLASEHEEACGTRTDRCDRCCCHVPRRDAESHGQPGGPCDAVIAAAEDHEKRVVMTGPSPSLHGSRIDGGGKSGAMGGRFDALLAEAVRSSKAASSALANARAENNARMLHAVEAPPPPRMRGSLNSHPGGGHGGGDGEYECKGKPEEAVVGADEGAAKGPSGCVDNIATSALEPCRARAGNGSDGDLRRRSHRDEIGANSHLEETGVLAASYNPSCSVNPRGVPGTPTRSTRPPAGSGPNDAKPSDNVGESWSREGARRPDSRSWACPRCTLINSDGSRSCEACGSGRSPTDNVLHGTDLGERQPGTKLFENGRSMDSMAEPAVVGTSPAALRGPTDGGVPGTSAQTAVAEPDTAVQLAGDAKASIARSSPQSQTTATPLPPDLLPPSGKTASPSKGRQTHANSQSPPAAALLSSPLSPSGLGPSENTRASGSAPQAFRGRNPGVTGSSDALEGDEGGGHEPQPLRTRHTAPANSSNAFSATGTRPGLVHAMSAGAPGPRARCLRSPAAFVPAGIHPLQPRGKNKSIAPQGVRAVHQRQQQCGRAFRRKGQPHARTVERRRLMGPPRRLGGVHRPSRLRHVPSSLPPSVVAPPTDTAAPAAAALTPGFRSVRELEIRHGHRHSREQSTDGLWSFSSPTPWRPSLPGGMGFSGGRGTVSATRPPPSRAAPACDVSLSILGRSQGIGGSQGIGDSSRESQMPDGDGRVRSGGAQTGGGSKRSGQESRHTVSVQQEVGGGTAAWGRSCGVGMGDEGAAAAAAAVGVAPLRLRRRVNDTRDLEPLIAR